ncbi:hypothetical protein JCM5350_004739 [Sporobolomyces pararoseus]
MRLRSTLVATLLLGSVAYAAKSTPPSPATTVDVAEPLPAEPPHPNSFHHPSDDSIEFDLSSAKVYPAAAAAHSTPAPSRAFTGPSYKLGPLVFHPNEYKPELFTLLFFLFYSLTFFSIRSTNLKTHSRFFKTIEPVLRQEFAGVGFGGDGKENLFKLDGSGGDESVCYCSGRRAIENCWITVKLKGYDLLSRSWYFLRELMEPGFDSGRNKIVIEFKLENPKGTPGFKQACFAILQRDKLKSLSSERWDLRTFTQLTESSILDPSLILMSESNDLTSSLLLDSKTGLKEMFQKKEVEEGGGGLEVFESLVLSDFGSKGVEPDLTKTSKISSTTDQLYLTLTLRLPTSSPSKTRDETMKDLITTVCNLGDFIHSKEKLLPQIQILKSSQRRSTVLEALAKTQKGEEETKSGGTTTNPTAQVKKRKMKTRK